MFHAIDHALCGLGVFKAGEAATRRGRLGWLAVAAVAFVRCHLHHHRK